MARETDQAGRLSPGEIDCAVGHAGNESLIKEVCIGRLAVVLPDGTDALAAARLQWFSDPALVGKPRRVAVDRRAKQAVGR